MKAEEIAYRIKSTPFRKGLVHQRYYSALCYGSCFDKAIGMPTVMENSNTVSIATVLKNIQYTVNGGIGAFYHLTESSLGYLNSDEGRFDGMIVCGFVPFLSLAPDTFNV